MPYTNHNDQLANSKARHERLKNDPEYKRKKLENAKAYYSRKKAEKNINSSIQPSQSSPDNQL